MVLESTKLNDKILITASEQELANNKKILLHLITAIPQEFKALFVTSKIRAFMTDFVRAEALVKGDVYYTKFIESDTLEPEQFQAMFESITDGLITKDVVITKDVQRNQRLAEVVNLVFLGKQPENRPEFAVEKAFRVIGETIAAGAKAEEDKQYQAAVANDPQHVLEHRELKLLGHPYETIFREKLAVLEELDPNGYGNFNRVIRNLILQHQRKEITLDKFLNRLRYSAAMLAIALEQRGYIDESINIRNAIFDGQFVGDGKLLGAFGDKSKPNPTKKQPILTQETKEQAAGFFAKIKQHVKDLPDLFGFKDRKLPQAINNVQLNQALPQRMSEFLNKLEIEADPEAIRKLENRIVKLRAALNDIALAEFAGQNIAADDPIRADLPYNDPELLRAFTKHLEKVQQTVDPSVEKTLSLELS